MPLAVVVGPDCDEAVRTLILGLGSERTLEGVEWVSRDLDAACAYLDVRLRDAYAEYRREVWGEEPGAGPR